MEVVWRRQEWRLRSRNSRRREGLWGWKAMKVMKMWIWKEEYDFLLFSFLFFVTQRKWEIRKFVSSLCGVDPRFFFFSLFLFLFYLARERVTWGGCGGSTLQLFLRERVIGDTCVISGWTFCNFDHLSTLLPAHPTVIRKTTLSSLATCSLPLESGNKLREVVQGITWIERGVISCLGRITFRNLLATIMVITCFLLLFTLFFLRKMLSN